MSADPVIVCIDTFENDDISGCFPAPTEPCSTGVINELGECEPVGVTPPDLECQGICGPAVVALPATPIRDECWLDSNPLTALPSGQFLIYGNGADHPTATGTHSRSGMPCGPIPVAASAPATQVEVATPHTEQPTLPATGSPALPLSVLGTVILLAGALLKRVAA
jgi:hypothetical protein